jgi:hypothetical protein
LELTMTQRIPVTPNADPARTEAMLQQLRAALTSASPDESAFRHLLARQRATRRQRVLTLILAGSGVAATVLIGLREAQWEAALAVLAMLFPAVALTIWTVAHQRSSLARLAERAADFHDDWQRDVRQQIRATAVGVVAMAVFIVGISAFALRGWLPLWQQLFMGAVAALATAGLGRALLVEMRDLRHEYRLITATAHD